jgi:phytoene dehydrogenase-like protein
VVEAAPEPGGAVRSGELTLPGYTHDLFSAFYPLAAASPVIRALRLDRWGLRWRHAPAVLAHPLDDGRCALLSTNLTTTAASLDSFAPGDGAAWRSLYELWERTGRALLDAITRPLPAVPPALRLAGALRPRGIVPFARFALLPATRMAAERFRGAGGGVLLAGNALHTDVSPASSPSGIFAWLLVCLGQQIGWPVPAGGAGKVTDALVARLRARGGSIECNARATRIEVRGGRAVAVGTSKGVFDAARAVIATTGAPALFTELLAPEHVPPRIRERLQRFEYDHATVKVDWALDRPVPWSADEARTSAAVHVGGSMEEMIRYASELDAGLIPGRPFLVMGQMNVADPTRSPEGTETAWAYTHIPQRARVDGDEVADRMEAQIERFAPGFRATIRARHVFDPAEMEETNPNLVGGAVNGGSAQLHQQLLFRPAPGLSRGTTPVKGLYLGSASIHPGGGVHGAPGATAARAALAADRRARLLGRRS